MLCHQLLVSYVLSLPSSAITLTSRRNSVLTSDGVAGEDLHTERRYDLSSLLRPITMSRASSSFCSSRDRFEDASFGKLFPMKLVVAKICVHLFPHPSPTSFGRSFILYKQATFPNFIKRGKSSKVNQVHLLESPLSRWRNNR